ncbi:MAG: NUDIX domain-containing protein [Treponema sp.]|nr:NUDIX domain-containing protein [Treponema sp.]
MTSERIQGNMFKYCPSCASKTIRFEQNRVFRCPECGFVYYHNTAAATAAVIRTGQGLLFTVRGRDPGKGKLDFPGGFVDPGEGAADGLRRECIEELGWDPGDLASALREDGGAGRCRLLASFPNVYPYKNCVYNTCDLFFVIDVPDLTEADLRPDPAELAGLRFIRREELDCADIAFESVKRALRVLEQC